MRIGRVFYLVGEVNIIIGAAMLLPLFCTLWYGESDWRAFLLSIPICLAVGALLMALCWKCRRQTLRQRETYLFVTMAWLLAPLTGALPYVFYGCGDFAICLFESFSGFTTTGATALADVELMPHGILFWRALTHWLGGAGIVLLFVALIQNNNSGEGLNIYRAEYSGGFFSERIAVRIEDNAKLIFAVYTALTVLCLFCLMTCGMRFFDAVTHAMSITATGGFSIRNASIAAYGSPLIEWVTTLFLFLSGISFALFYIFFVRRRFRHVLADQELRTYTLVIVLAAGLILASMVRGGYAAEVGFGTALRHSLFQTVSILTSGGFVCDNYDAWPALARGVLLLLLFCGGCAGSTASGIKIRRWIIAIKTLFADLRRHFRPRLAQSIHYNGKKVEESISRRTLSFLVLFFLLTLFGSLSLIGCGMYWPEACTAAAACLGNVGPAWGGIGPVGTYAGVSAAGKYICCFLMLVGRLEINTVLVLFIPAIWRD